MTTQEILYGLEDLSFYIKPQYRKPIEAAIGYIRQADREKKEVLYDNKRRIESIQICKKKS